MLTLECFLGLASLVRSTSFTGRYMILDIDGHARPIKKIARSVQAANDSQGWEL